MALIYILLITVAYCHKDKIHFETTDKDNPLPLGIRCNGKLNKYYGVIQLTGRDKHIRLSDWDNKDDAFAEYKVMKQADIKLVLARYINKIPRYIYEKFLEVEIQPY